MSEFVGGGSRVRCVECTHLSGGSCSFKKTKVTPKKRRICDAYNFKGEYVNRTSPEAMYTPYVDGNTRRLIQKMIKLGIVPVGQDLEANQRYKPTNLRSEKFDGCLEMPKSTATAKIIATEAREEGMVQHLGSPEEQGFGAPFEPEAATTVKVEDDESNNSRG